MIDEREPIAPASAVPWSITLDGVPLPLNITTDAIIGIEATTGRTLYQHAQAATERAVPLAHMALILRFLAGPAAPITALRAPYFIAGVMGPVDQAEGTEPAVAIILRNGMIDVLACVMVPIVAALKACVDASGGLLPGYDPEE